MAVQWGKMANDPERARQAADEGFDFVQAGAELLEQLEQAEVLERPGRKGLPLTVCAVPLPAEARVTQPGFNLYLWTEHLKRSLARLAGLGCRMLAWSDGRARVLPPEGEVAALKEQVLQFLFLLCEVAGSFGITVLVEPLGPRRTNFLNTLEATGAFLQRVGKPNLSSMLSLREMEAVGLEPADLPRHRALIAHVQLDNPRLTGGPRRSPRPDDGVDYRPFLRALRHAGFAGTVGLPEDADAAGLEYCRSLWGD